MKTPDRIKVLHVISGLGMGGAERLLLWAARYHDRERYLFRIVSLMSGGDMARGIRETGVSLVELGQKRGRLTPRGFGRLVGELRRFRPQVIQGHMFHSNLLTRLTRPLACPGGIVINTIHTGHQGWRRNVLDSLTSRLANGFITFSPRAEEIFSKTGPGGRPVRFIPYGIEITSRSSGDRHSMRVRLGLPSERFIWIAVGSLTKAKAFGDLIEAFGLLAVEGSGPVLLIAGEGEQGPVLREMVRKKGLGGEVRFMCLRRDIPDLMAVSDAFVLSSRWEGNPLVLLEAMAASLPVVATKVGVVQTMARDGKTGILVTPRQPRLLAQAMMQVMAMGNRARVMGEEGRKRLEKFYDFRRTQREVERFYEDLVQVDHGSPEGDEEP